MSRIYIYICVCKFYVYTYMIHFSVYVRIGRGHVCVHQCAMGDGSAVCARVGGLVLRARPKTRNPKRGKPLPVGVDHVVASARRRSNRRRCSTPTSARGTPPRSPRCPMYAPLPAQAARTTADALGRASVRRGRSCPAAPPMRARVRTRVGTRLLGAMGVGTAARRGGWVHAYEIYIYVCVCVAGLHAYMIMYYPFICMSENRPALCLRAPVCDGDGSAVCARVGGLVLRARPRSRNPKPCEPLPVGVDRVRPRRAGVLRCVGVQREHRRVEHRGGHHVVLCMHRSRPRWRALRRTRSAGLRCGAAGCARRLLRCARACAHVQALACAGPWV
jgi:hypothetical protein